MPRLGRACLLVCALVLAHWRPAAAELPPYGGSTEFRADLAARRARMMDALGPNAVLVLWSAPTRVYSGDVDYEYRQDSDLLYLTGVDQEETVLVLVPGAKTKREWLFVRDADPRRELWNGHVLTPAEAGAQSGIANVSTAAAFLPFLNNLFSGTAAAEAAADEFAAVTSAVKAGTATVSLLLEPTPRGSENPPPPPGSRREFAAEMHQKYPGVSGSSARTILNTLRAVKTPYEQRVLRRSAEISAEAHIEGMKAARPGRWEYEVEAAIEYWYLKNGAMSWGYPSIVGSGPNSTTLHYEKSTRQMRDGELLLVDAAANFQGLTADLTRTYPINGRFSAAQRAIYDLVLLAQEAGIAAAQLGKPSSDIQKACNTVFGPGLLKLGLITENTPAQIRMWFPHGPTHGIGMDVHDPLSGLAPLAPGMAFTIEPGLYIRMDTLDNLAKTPENARIIEAVRPMVLKYQDIGVRIEDSFLMTEAGVVNLTAKAPRQIAQIEKVVGTGR